MKSLSQSEYGELRDLYQSVYATEEVVTEEIINEVVDELVEELVEEGYEEEEAYSLVEEATDTYIDEAKVTFGHDTAPKKADGSPVGSRRRYGMRKAGELVKKAKGAVDTVKKKAAGAAAGAAIAGSIAKDEVRRAGRSAAHSASKAADAVKSAPGKAKEKAKSGIKGFIKRQAQKVVKRMSEDVEQLDELSSKTLKSYTDKADADHGRLYKKVFKAEKKGKHKKARKHEMKAISREDGISRALSKIDKQKVEKGKPTTDYERRSAKDVKVAAKDPSLMDRAKGAVKKALRKEDLEATGLFTAEEIENLVELSTDTLNSYMDKAEKDVEAKLDKAREQSKEARFSRLIRKDKKAEKLDKKAQNNRIKAADRDDRIDQAYTKVKKAQGTENKFDKKFPPVKGAKVPAQLSKKALRKEDLEATGLFTVKEIEAIMEAEMSEAMSSYDRNRKRAAERAAARNAARDAGKTGVVPGVGYVTPRRERETYVDSSGTTRHKSGAKMPKEEFELDENRRAARAAGGYKDDSKKQTDPSKAGFTGISNSIADIMRQNKEIEARKKK